MKEELVSIIIPTYNRKYIIYDAIKSCITQSYKTIEIIICDDHSSDGTQEYIDEIMKEDGRIRYCVTPEGKKGANAARNAGIRIAKGRYVTFLDLDDYLLPDSILNRVSLFEKSKAVMVYGNAVCQMANSKVKWNYPDINQTKENQKKYLMQELSLCQQNTIMVKRDVFKKIGLLDEEQRGWTDDGLVVAIGMRYPILHSNKYVAVVRKSTISMTSNKWNLYYGCKKLINKYKKQILYYASFKRYVLWQVRLFSQYCYAHESETDEGSFKYIFWRFLHIVSRNLIWPYFINHFE